MSFSRRRHVDQLVGSATKFLKKLWESKSTLSDTEDITLQQMRDVREKVSEPAIRTR